VLSAQVAEVVLSERFRYSPEVLKAYLPLEQAVPAPVAQPIPVVLALYQDKGGNGKPEKALLLSFLR